MSLKHCDPLKEEFLENSESFLHFKDICANCFCPSLLHTQFTLQCHATTGTPSS